MDKRLEQNTMLKEMLKILLQSVKEGRFFAKAAKETITSPLLKANGSKQNEGSIYRMAFDLKGIEKVKKMQIEMYVYVEDAPELIERV